MANFYTDIPELKYHLNNPMMQRICELKERGYEDKDKFDYAPQDYADAIDSYDKVLEITGEITGEIIAPNAEGVDEEGPHCANGRVEYASGTKQNLDAMVKAGLNGMTMPRRFGGLNFPITPYTMCAEIVAAADAGFGNIWSLQDCIETLYEFGNEDQHSRFIPRICAGETTYSAAATFPTLASFAINVLSVLAVCRLYRNCICNNGSALTPSAASNSNAVFSDNGLCPFKISFNAE